MEKLPTCNLEFAASYLGSDMGYPEVSRDFPQFFKAFKS
jgi:hypothetical protein